MTTCNSLLEWLQSSFLKESKADSRVQTLLVAVLFFCVCSGHVSYGNYVVSFFLYRLHQLSLIGGREA